MKQTGNLVTAGYKYYTRFENKLKMPSHKQNLL